MNIDVGVDIIERKRIKQAILKHPKRFLKKIYTQRELENLPVKNELYHSIGFSLKEAVWKTLPPHTQKKTYFEDIEIIWNKDKPQIFLFGKKAKNFHIDFSFNKKIVITSALRIKTRRVF
ncbi:MAG TPA: 4'-phosphopantetheinyl transferase superfamily protein [bacterium]|nr:4'-phosphopantetheinyl transferase superfamily protein [bacterium]